MHECFPKHFGIESARMKLDKETEEVDKETEEVDKETEEVDKTRRVNMERSTAGTKKKFFFQCSGH